MNMRENDRLDTRLQTHVPEGNCLAVARRRTSAHAAPVFHRHQPKQDLEFMLDRSGGSSQAPLDLDVCRVHLMRNLHCVI